MPKANSMLDTLYDARDKYLWDGASDRNCDFDSQCTQICFSRWEAEDDAPYGLSYWSDHLEGWINEFDTNGDPNNNFDDFEEGKKRQGARFLTLSMYITVMEDEGEPNPSAYSHY